MYAGDYDFISNWIGIDRWTRALEWTGGEAFASAELRAWKVDGADAGKVRSYGDFTFATVHRAGHMVSRAVIRREKRWELTHSW